MAKEYSIPTGGAPICLVLKVKSDSKTNVRISFRDSRKPDTYYASRGGIVNGEAEFQLNMPVTPKVGILSISNSNDKILAGSKPLGKANRGDEPSNIGVEITNIDVTSVRECPIQFTPATREFVKFALDFSQRASILSSGKYDPTIIRSSGGNFQINYFDEILDRNTLSPVTTPARIGHRSGIIEVSKADYLGFSVPIRFLVLTHEYSHVFLNRKHGFEIDDETASDLHALEIFLSMGFSPIEASYAFLKVFDKGAANNEANALRYKYIKDFIEQFTSGKIGCDLGFNNGTNGGKSALFS